LPALVLWLRFGARDVHALLSALATAPIAEN
jgi:hypothetical protein